MTQTLTVKLVQGDNGSIDTEATTAAFQDQLAAHVANVETESSQIASKVAELFADNKNKGKYIALPTVGSLTAHMLGAVSENFQTFSERVCDYVRANSKGDDSLFVIRKGSGGGCGLRADVAVKAAQ